MMPLTVRDVSTYLAARCLWAHGAYPEEILEYGAADAPVMGIAVGWQATQDALTEAHALGCTLFIALEPTFYPAQDGATRALNARKRAWLEKTGISILCCAEAWEGLPRLGLREAFGAFLRLGEPTAQEALYTLYAVPSITAWEVAFRVGRRIADLGGQAVQFIGSRSKIVRRVALTLGRGIAFDRLAEIGAEALIMPDTGLDYARDPSRLAEEGLPTIIVPGQVAALPGLRALAEDLQAHFGVRAPLVGAACPYEIWAAEYFRDIHLRMRRDRLDDLPPITLPEGYTLRPMEPDEVWAYLRVMNASNYAGEADEAWFERVYGRNPEYDPHFLQIIWKGEEPVAAAGAWHAEIAGERWGAVEWVGVVETERGKGLGKAIVLAALRGIRARGMERAMLATQAWRLPAIATYLSLGFRPWPDARAPQAVWDRVLQDLAAWKEAQNRQ
ncbi:MAG: Nif3-like dinuclear metal center hexameric protein [Chloroflexi bacterium]|nr:Nif3-like dinuclear metal center hexameric protein [Chloroflexota bacterium]